MKEEIAYYQKPKDEGNIMGGPEHNYERLGEFSLMKTQGRYSIFRWSIIDPHNTEGWVHYPPSFKNKKKAQTQIKELVKATYGS